MELSKLSWSIRGTLGRKLLRKSLQYTGVVDFTLGDPDIPTPDGICKAAIRAIKEHVAVTPGLSFGDAFDGYIRLAFTLNDDALREGAKRIRHFIESLVSEQGLE